MAFAVIKTAGKQYLVNDNQFLKLDKKIGEVGETVTFDTILLTADEDGKNVKIGEPVLAGVTVEAEVVRQGHSRTVRVVNYKSKTRQHKVYGHRQPFTQVKITAIGGVASKPVTEEKAPVKESAEKKTVAKKAPAKKPAAKTAAK